MKTKKSECNGCNNFEYDNSCRSQFKCATDGRSFFTLNTPDWCPGREEITKMNAMESKKCEWCGDYFSRKKGSQVSECLACKSENDGDEVEKLPTKKEVTERLQNAIDVINKYAFGKIYLASGGAENLFFVSHESKHGNFISNIGAAHFRPKPKPPERLAAVVDPGGRWYVSRGCLDNEGKLRIMGTLDIIVHWYCPSTGEHSKGWKKEWTPEEFKK